MSECNNCDKYDYQTHSCPIFCDVIRNTLDDVRADERAKTIEEMAKIITELNDDTTMCNSLNCPRADEPITCTICTLERAIKQMEKEQKGETE